MSIPQPNSDAVRSAFTVWLPTPRGMRTGIQPIWLNLLNPVGHRNSTGISALWQDTESFLLQFPCAAARQSKDNGIRWYTGNHTGKHIVQGTGHILVYISLKLYLNETILERLDKNSEL